MPAKSPRITVTLTPAVAAALRTMSELAGNSQSAIVGEILEQSTPMFERVVKVLQAAKRLKESSNRERERIASSIADDLEVAQARLEAQLGLQLEDLDRTAGDLADQAEKVERRGVGERAERAPRRPAAPATPMSNRGVTPQSRKGAQKRRKPTSRSVGG